MWRFVFVPAADCCFGYIKDFCQFFLGYLRLIKQV
nr:MAG TPA: hypothetical protein [Caudoviricetes sp.]